MKKFLLSITFVSTLVCKTASALVSPYIGAGGLLTYDKTNTVDNSKKFNPSFNVNLGMEVNAIIAKFGFEAFYEEGFSKSKTPTLYGAKVKLFLINLVFIEPYVFGGIGEFKYNNTNSKVFATGGIGINKNLFNIGFFTELGLTSSITSSNDFKRASIMVGARYYFF